MLFFLNFLKLVIMYVIFIFCIFLQYFLINFVDVICVSIRCAICLWRWSKFIALGNYNYDDCFSTCSYNLSCLFKLLMNVLVST